MLQKDISFSHKVQMLLASMNLYVNLPAYNLISHPDKRDEINQ